MAWTRAALGLVLAGAVGLALVSGGSGADPQTPAALPGMPPPFLGTAVAGGGGLTAAVDAYGDVVDLRAPGPAGRGLIDNRASRQEAGSVSAETGIVPGVRIGGAATRALWSADSILQRYLPGTNVVRTAARFGRVTVVVSGAALGEVLAEVVEARAPAGVTAVPTVEINLAGGSGCARGRQAHRVALVCSAGASRAANSRSNPIAQEASEVIRAAGRTDRRWLGRALSLATDAPRWARRMYARSLLTLRALTDRRTGAVAAGARDGWAYVWPRDAGTAALALAAAGYRAEARQVAHFLLGLNLGAAARFDGTGDPVGGRGAQGDAAGWVAVAARAAGLPSPAKAGPWRNRPDYQEGAGDTYLANAIAGAIPAGDVSDFRGHIWGVKSDTSREKERQAAHITGAFGAASGLVRRAGDPRSGLDSAAAWAVRPFPLPSLFPAVRGTLLRLSAEQTRFGIRPSQEWHGGTDPWSAPTAWTAWSLAALGQRRQSLQLLGDLRRASTPAGAIPERVDARTGVPRSTTPLAWSHAFAILALRQLWPEGV